MSFQLRRQVEQLADAATNAELTELLRKYLRAEVEIDAVIHQWNVVVKRSQELDDFARAVDCTDPEGLASIFRNNKSDLVSAIKDGDVSALEAYNKVVIDETTSEMASKLVGARVRREDMPSGLVRLTHLDTGVVAEGKNLQSAQLKLYFRVKALRQEEAEASK